MDSPTHPLIGRVTKTPIHTLTRVRNNQRRHRQRRREYIAFLEQRLKNTEDKLAQYQVENAALRSKIKSTSHLSQERSHTASLTKSETKMTTHVMSTTASASGKVRHYLPDVRLIDRGSASVTLAGVLQPDFPSQEMGSNSYDGTTIGDTPPFLLFPDLNRLNTEITLPMTCLTYPLAIQHRSACCSRSSPQSGLFNKDASWLSNQTPIYRASMVLSMSSTTMCSQAYLIIQHHNRRQLSMEAVERWLSPGFVDTSPSAKHGCRVDNQLLFGLLEYITDWESLGP